jgi:5-methylcytosine-specific restriction protein A
MAASNGERRPPPWTWGELLLACDLVVANEWRGLTATDPRVVELSALLQQLPSYPVELRGAKFRNPNGVARKTVDIATHHPDYRSAPTKGGRLDLDVISEFIDDPEAMADAAAALRVAVRSANSHTDERPDLDLERELEPSPEGRVLARLHLIRERDPKLRAAKIGDARKQLGYVRCEVCNFDFERTYGSHGRDYIECHHRTPLSHSGPTMTKLEDLALLCSNCHRMIHRRQPWLSIDELRELIT